MQEVLITKLHDYLISNHPDLLFTLQQESGITPYLLNKVAVVNDLFEELLAEGKPQYIIEETCMEALTKELRPSKYNYLLSILEEEFEPDFLRLKKDGIQTCEVINMITAFKPVFETFGFTEESEDDPQLYYAITGSIHEYLKIN